MFNHMFTNPDGQKPFTKNKPLIQLKKTYLDELDLWKTHYGRYLKLIYIGEPFKINAIQGRCAD